MLSAFFRSTYLVLSTPVVGHPLPISLSGNFRNGLGINTTMKNIYIRAKRVSNCYMQEKKTDRLCGCLYVRLILVFVLGRQIVYGQNTVYLCLSRSYRQPVQQYKHHVVRSIARSGVSPPGARSDGHHWCQAERTAATCT